MPSWIWTVDTGREEMLSPLAPGHASTCLGTVSRAGTKCGDERWHPREVHAQMTHARPRGAWKPWAHPQGLWLYSWLTSPAPRPSARLVSAPRDRLLYFLALWPRVRCVPVVSVSREQWVLFELQRDCWFRITVKRLWVSNRFFLFNLKRLSTYPQG